jgi:NDP-sugar pyrophosphorylase family protein
VQTKKVEIDLGVLELDDRRVTGYSEKPTLSYDVSMGIYVYEARALDHLPDGPCSFPELVHLLLAAGEDVCAYRSDDAWYDLGTVSEYERAVSELDHLGGALA